MPYAVGTFAPDTTRQLCCLTF